MRGGDIRTPWSKAMRDLLADGEWHDFDEVLDVGALRVPPGVAWREYQRGRRSHNTQRVHDHSDAVAMGARRKARIALDGWPQLERDGRRVRLPIR